MLYLFALLLVVPASARRHEKGADTFSIDLEEPYQTVVEVVREIAGDGKIRGTFEYKGDQYLPGADSPKSCVLFKSWDGPGEVFFKIRRNALSPAHFIESNDVGNVAVRYIVVNGGPNSTRLLIDAVFVENGHHHHHPSDGSVETSEFAVIGKRLKEIDAERVAAQPAPGQPSSRESSSRPQGAVQEARQNEVVIATNQPVAPPPSNLEAADAAAADPLQTAVEEQKSRRDEAQAEVDRLEAQAHELRAAAVRRVTSNEAVLKALPYTHSATLKNLSKGDEVMVLAKSSYWYRVRVPRRLSKGQEGWIYHLFLEPAP